MALNLGAVVLFAVNLLLRTPWGRALTGDDASLPLLLSIAGVAVVGVSGWLGGEMVYVERVGVEEAGARAAEEARRRAA
ncbi:MAG TPA: DUF2231 domain-containing protein [Methylomirabilota bacterium]|nr:DUF2231 domain-containing protein [Methylomirabilota bacterium]